MKAEIKICKQNGIEQRNKSEWFFRKKQTIYRTKRIKYTNLYSNQRKIRDEEKIRDKKGSVILDMKTSENLDIKNYSHAYQT